MGEADFQRLCAAIIAHKFDKVRCYPVGQKDGGRDIKRTTVDGDVIYQVKWSKNAVRDPVTWLTKAVEGERAKIRRHVANGATRYILVTSVAGTSAMASDKTGRGAGTIDRVDEAIETLRVELGLKEMDCWWREDLDAQVVNAPTNILWRFQKMLAGAEAMRFVLEAGQAEFDQHRLALIIRKTVSAQWSQDSKVKFKQVELDNDDLEDLFIDVKASVTSPTAQRIGVASPTAPIGAVQHLVKSKQPFTLVRGEPGQGKSTLSQQLCQIYRSAFIDDDPGVDVKRPALRPEEQRVPLRVDLRDYGSWLEGHDPFAEVITATGKTPKPRANGGLEHFLASALTRWAVLDKVDVGTINDLINRYPLLLVLDGLDEVAQRDTRSRVVRLIEQFAERWRYGGIPPKIVVTTRPNVADLAEPTQRLFEVATLTRLDRELRSDYLRKWSAVRGIRGADKRSLLRSFDTRTAEPHIAQLAENPMQLTILLYLLHLRGQSIPDRRTALYDDYMRTFLDREAEKSASVRDNRTNLEEVTAYLGWFLHGWAEQQGSAGRLKTSELRVRIFAYLDQASKDTSLVNALFTDVTDRVWALSSKTQGTFEFDVQPVREYFAAKYLSRFASVDKSEILKALIRRPFWFNVSRFFAGFANPNEIGGLVDGLTEEVAVDRHPMQLRTAVWTLLADGVFSAKIVAQDRAVALLTDDLSVRLIHGAVSSGGLPALPASSGGVALALRLLGDAAKAPARTVSVERVRIVTALGLDSPSLGQWWLTHARPVLSTEAAASWLALGRSWNAGSLLTESDHGRLALPDDQAVATAIAAGVTPRAGTTLEAKFIEAILGGSCSDIESPQTGLVADIVNVLAPRHFLSLAKPSQQPLFEVPSGHCESIMAELKRAAAFRRLKSANPLFGKIQIAMNIARRSTNTVQPWSDAAEYLRAIYGRSWLATEIAIIGAAIDPQVRRDLGPMSPHAACFGPDLHYGNLVNDVRVHRNHAAWWMAARSGLTGIDLATWIHALVAVATAPVIDHIVSILIAAVDSLDAQARQAVLFSSSRLGLSGVSRRLPTKLVTAAACHSMPTALLLMHHADDLKATSNLSDLLGPKELTEAAHCGTAAWPALRAVGRELVLSATDEWLPVLAEYGASAVAGPAQGELATNLGQQILAAPGLYPAKWIEIAEHCISQSSVESPLLTTTDMWFE